MSGSDNTKTRIDRWLDMIANAEQARHEQLLALRRAANLLVYEGKTTPAPAGIFEPRWRAMQSHYLRYGAQLRERNGE